MRTAFILIPLALSLTACYNPLGPFAPRATPTPGPTPDPVIGKFCGGIAADLPENQCPDGYYCLREQGYPDAGGTCQRRAIPTPTPTTEATPTETEEGVSLTP